MFVVYQTARTLLITTIRTDTNAESHISNTSTNPDAAAQKAAHNKNGLISAVTEDNRETTFLFQRLSIALQRGNAVSFQNTMNTT